MIRLILVHESSTTFLIKKKKQKKTPQKLFTEEGQAKLPINVEIVLEFCSWPETYFF